VRRRFVELKLWAGRLQTIHGWVAGRSNMVAVTRASKLLQELDGTLSGEGRA
jgi:hypothetical protein